MGMYKGSGTEPLRSDPKAMSGKVTSTPAGTGKDVGGTEKTRTNHQVKMAGLKKTPEGSTHYPPKLATFSGGKV